MEENVKKIVDQIIEFEIKGKPQDYQMIFVAGQTGGGKDTLVKKIVSQNNNKFVVIDMDDYRHYFQSDETIKDIEYAEKTNKYAYDIFTKIIEKVTSNKDLKGTNVIITGTMRNKEWTERIIRQFKEANYNIQIYALAVEKFESQISIIERYLKSVQIKLSRGDKYESPTRFTSMEYHEESIEGFLKTIESFIKQPEIEIQVYQRGKDLDKINNDDLLCNDRETAYNTIKEKINSEIDEKKYRERLIDILNMLKELKNYLEEQCTCFELVVMIKAILTELEQKKVTSFGRE